MTETTQIHICDACGHRQKKKFSRGSRSRCSKCGKEFTWGRQ